MKAALVFIGMMVAALTFACGGGSDSLTVEEYFAEFEAIDAEIDAQINEAFAAFPEDEESEASFLADEANLPALKGIAAAFARISSDSLRRLKELDPPSELEEGHRELVDALEDFASAFEEANDELQGTETMAEFSALNDELDSTLIAPAGMRFDEACLDLVAIGEANGITVIVTTCQDGG